MKTSFDVPVSTLCKALALYHLLEDFDALDEGLPLREVERHWPSTGLRLEDLDELLTQFEPTGDFELIPSFGGPRLRAPAFEERQLNPETLAQIEALAQAYTTLEAIQGREPGGMSYGRRVQDSLH